MVVSCATLLASTSVATGLLRTSSVSSCVWNAMLMTHCSHCSQWIRCIRSRFPISDVGAVAQWFLRSAPPLGMSEARLILALCLRGHLWRSRNFRSGLQAAVRRILCNSRAWRCDSALSKLSLKRYSLSSPPRLLPAMGPGRRGHGSGEGHHIRLDFLMLWWGARCEPQKRGLLGTLLKSCPLALFGGYFRVLNQAQARGKPRGGAARLLAMPLLHGNC